MEHHHKRELYFAAKSSHTNATVFSLNSASSFLGSRLTFYVTSKNGDVYSDSNSSVARIVLPKMYDQTIDVAIIQRDEPSKKIYLVVNSQSSESHITLMNGYAYRDVALYHGQRFFVIEVPCSATILDITVLTLSGDADVFVNGPHRGFYNNLRPHDGGIDDYPDWISVSTTALDTISINTSAIEKCRDSDFCTFFVTVYAYHESSFEIVSIIDNTVLVLNDHSAQRMFVEEGKYRYFVFDTTQARRKFDLELVSIAGDADIFVSCTLSPTGNDQGFPSRFFGHYNFSSSYYLDDAVSLSPGTVHSCSSDSKTDVSLYYIAIFGSTDSLISLAARYEDSIQYLSAGMPQEGEVFARLGTKFLFWIGNRNEEVRIVLTSFDGDADLFVRQGKEASLFLNDYRSNRAGNDIDEVVIPEAEVCANCWISVLVYGFKTSHFSIVYYLSDTVVMLVVNTPQKGSVPSNTPQYYSFTASETGNYSIALTVFSGYPSLYSSRSHIRPNYSSSDTSISTSFSTSVFPNINMENTKKGETIFIAVDGQGVNSTYTLRISPQSFAGNLLRLLEGVPQRDLITLNDASSWRYYKISLPLGHENLIVRCSDIEGNVDVFLWKCPVFEENCNFLNVSLAVSSSVDLYYDILKYSRNDISSTSYVIGILSVSMVAEYQVSYNLDSSILKLQPGVTVLDHVRPGESDFYSFVFIGSDRALEVALLPFVGNPDLYISCTNSHPGPDNYTWSSTSFGDDFILIDPSKDKYACVDCVYYIAVFGIFESTYSIYAQTELTFQRLIDGFPVHGHVASREWKYFLLVDPYGSTRNIRLTLSVLDGDADLYVMIGEEKPTLTSYDYYASNIFVDDVIFVRQDDPRLESCMMEYRCSFVVGVFGIFGADFSLTYSSESSAVLIRQNSPITDVVLKDELKHYRAYLGGEFFNRSISVSRYLRIGLSQFSGNCAGYVSCRNPQPDIGDHDFVVVPSNFSSFVLPAVALDDAGCFSGSMIYISIRGVTDASYSLLLTEDSADSLSLLRPGVSLTGSLWSQQFQYYYVRPGKSFEDIKLSLSVLSGEADLYVSKDWSEKPYWDSKSHKVQSFSWVSANAGSDLLTIPHGSVADLCENRVSCYIVVAVFSTYTSDYPSSFMLSATLEDSTTLLTTNFPARGAVESRRYEYYKYSIFRCENDVVFAVTCFGGDVDIYVSMSPVNHPTRLNYTWMSGFSGDDSITIDQADLQYHCKSTWDNSLPCEFYLGLYGWKNSSYSLLAMIDHGFENAIQLLDQQPQEMIVSEGRYIFFKYMIPQLKSITDVVSSIHFTLNCHGYGDADLYLSFASHGEPSKHNFDYKSTNWADTLDEIEISPNSPGFCSDCLVYIAVYGFSLKTSFSITASSRGLIMLEDGISIGGHGSKDHFSYYCLYSNDIAGHLHVSLTSVVGDSDLFMNSYPSISESDPNFHLPSFSHAMWRSTLTGDDALSVSYRDPNYCYDCYFIIGVFSYSNTTYTLLVTSSEATVVRLKLNIPQFFALSPNKIQYFSFEIGNSLDDLSLSLSSLGASSVEMALQAYNVSLKENIDHEDLHDDDDAVHFQHDRLPNPDDPSTYFERTNSLIDPVISIVGPFDEPMKYILATRSPYDASFTVSVSSTSRRVILQSNIPQHQFVEEGNLAMFVLFVDDPEDLDISLTSKSGDPDLIISSQIESFSCEFDEGSRWNYHCNDYTWMSRTVGVDQIRISKDFPCEPIFRSTVVSESCDSKNSYQPGKPLYIGVFGYRASRFTLLVTPRGKHIDLVAGKPQISSTWDSYSCYTRSSKTGACLDISITDASRVDISYFRFRVPPSGALDSAAIISLHSPCNSSLELDDSHCTVGCSCNPFVVSIKSCIRSKCGPLDALPSPLYQQYQQKMTIYPGKKDFVLIDSESPAYCHSVDDSCFYYIAVSTTFYTGKPVSFSIIGRTPGDIQFVPCDLSHDGNRVVSIDSTSKIYEGIDGNVVRNFEICSPSLSLKDDKKSHRVTLDECTGHGAFFLCSEADDCPNIVPDLTSWSHYSENGKVCDRVYSDHKYMDTCKRSLTGEIVVPFSEGNLYVGVSGNQRYELHIDTLINGHPIRPELRMVDSLHENVLHVDKVGGQSIRLSWSQVGILFQGSPALFRSDKLKYHVLIFPSSVLGEFNSKYRSMMSSMCGFEFARSFISSSGERPHYLVVSPIYKQRESLEVSKKISDLDLKSDYSVFVLATCDSHCLGHASKNLGSGDATSLLDCSSEGSCSSISFGYQPMVFSTLDKRNGFDDKNYEDSPVKDSTSWFHRLVSLSVALIVLFLILMAIAYYKWKRHMGWGGFSFLADTEMTAVNHLESSSSRSNEAIRNMPAMSSSSSSSSSLASSSSRSASAYVPPSLPSKMWSSGVNMLDSLNSAAHQMKQRVQQQIQPGNVVYSQLWTDDHSSMNTYNSSNNDNDNDDEVVIHL